MKQPNWAIAKKGHKIMVIAYTQDNNESAWDAYHAIADHFGGRLMSVRGKGADGSETVQLSNGNVELVPLKGANRDYVTTHYGLEYTDVTAKEFTL